MIREQATRIEPPKPENSLSEKVGCLSVAAVFLAMCVIVCAFPYVIAWAVGVI